MVDALRALPEAPADPNEALVARARSGDHLAFARLIKVHERNAMATAVGLLKNRPLAEEAVQDAFCRTWQSLASLRDDSKFKGWFTAILYRVCRDQQRAQGRERKHLARLGEAAGDAAPKDPVATPVVEEAMELPEEYRDPLVLYYLQELSIEELAGTLGISEQNAKVRLHRARKMLRERMEGKGYRARHGGDA